MNITRFHGVEELKLSVEFLTPTFLGGADQQAELRSAPFKNLLRQWWRVANGHRTDADLRTTEGKIFGAVTGEETAHASCIRLWLSGESKVSFNKLDLGTMKHPEVQFNNGVIDKALYLGYGPITLNKGTRSYLAAGSCATLRIRCSGEVSEDLDNCLQLANHFGTIGSRNRNGFGSIQLSGSGFVPCSWAKLSKRPLDDLLRVKRYPHGLGVDDNGRLLLWETNQEKANWNCALAEIGEIYKDVRTRIDITSHLNSPQRERPFHAQPDERHLLGYPVTNHVIRSRDFDWGDATGRMPSQLRLMVKRNAGGRFVGRILHLPHKLPKPWPQNITSELDLWKSIHTILDNRRELRRIQQ